MLILSNTDALLVAVPMIGLLVVGHFRLDELFGKPRKTAPHGRGFAGGACEGKQGRPVCIDPDGMSRSGESYEQRKLPPTRRPRVRMEREPNDL